MKSNMNTNKQQNLGNSPMIRIAAFIVDKRALFILIFSIGIIFSIVASNWVTVQNKLSAYLPSDAETTVALKLMDEQFTTYGTAKVMVSNVTYDEAKELSDKINDLSYVAMVQFDSTTSHYNDFSALYEVTFNYPATDERALTALDKLKDELSDYDINVSTTMGDQNSKTVSSQMQIITVYVAIIVVAVLLFTCSSYAEVPVLILTFLASAILAKGTNFIFGTISFVSNSVTIVLQLALSVDYAVIFINRYKDEHKRMDARLADIIALSKAIPEISASSLTTIGGLIAMAFMQFKVGPDMAIVLIKAIVLSLLSVFLLMPGLIMIFADLMDKTTHKNFVPKIPFVGKFAYATRFVVPFIFFAVIAGAFYFQQNTPYVYGYTLLETPKQSEQDRVKKLINSTFDQVNFVALIVPGNDYDKEAELLQDLTSRDEVKSCTALASTKAIKDVVLTQKLTSREFAELTNMDKEITDVLYAAYAINDENYAKLINGVSNYSVPLIDMFLFLHQEVEEGYVTLDSDMQKTLDTAYAKITTAKNQLQGPDYDRILVYLNLPEEGTETFAFLDEMHTIAKKYYGEEANILVAGDSTSQYDLCKTFAVDNDTVTVISMLAVLVVLLFTFKSAGMPVLLILVIEGCVWINFAIPTLEHTNIFFMCYLIVSSIQMGANIDYAIVVSSRYQEVKQTMSRRDAIIDSMSFAFPTIITSGTMMVMAGELIGMMTSEPCICGIGQCLGRGTIISIITVLFVLPQILLLGDKIIDKTSFDVSLPLPSAQVSNKGLMRIDGVVNGRINGYVVGTVHAVVRGDVNAQIISGDQSNSEETQASLTEASNRLAEGNDLSEQSEENGHKEENGYKEESSDEE